MYLLSVKKRVLLLLRVWPSTWPCRGSTTWTVSGQSFITRLKFEETWTWWLWVYEKRSASVCRRQELANALYKKFCIKDQINISCFFAKRNCNLVPTLQCISSYRTSELFVLARVHVVLVSNIAHWKFYVHIKRHFTGLT